MIFDRLNPFLPLEKIMLFLGGWMILWLPVAIPLAVALRWKPFAPLTPTQKLPLLASLYGIVPLAIWGMLWLEKTTINDYGLVWDSSLFISLLIGLILAIGGLGLVWVIESQRGWIQWQWINLSQLGKLCLPLLALGLWVGLTEEFIFRGLFLTEIEQSWGFIIASVISSVIFALLHLIWERQETLPQLPGLWVMGMVLAIARWVDHGNLGLAWGLHAGWIWGLSAIDSANLITYTGKAKPWVIGINQQPLAGIVGIIYLLLTGVIIWQFFP